MVVLRNCVTQNFRKINKVSQISTQRNDTPRMKLVRLLMKLNNETVEVELKNGTIIKGTILTVSPTMNIVLKDVKMTVKHRDSKQVEYISIRGNHVRHIVLPDALNFDQLLQETGRKRKLQAETLPNKRVKRGL